MRFPIIIFCLVWLPLGAVQNKPWLGNWLEFEGSFYQKHTQSRKIDTIEGTKSHYLHCEETVLSLEFMPLEALSTELELDFAKTQSHSYGFESVRAGARYLFLNDLREDPISLAVGATCALSTPARVKDLSSSMHGVFEADARIALGREFGYTDSSYSQIWLLGLVGAASTGSPWVGGELHFDRVFFDKHLFDLSFRIEKGLSQKPLRKLHRFHSWSRINYEYEDIALKYSYKEVALGSFYIQCSTRLHARYCPKNSWSIELGFLIPFSPW